MTETQVAGAGKSENFLVAGFREVGRMFSRFSLRQTMKRQATERAAALTAVGQRAWDQKIDLSAFGDLREKLTSLDARAGEISQTRSKLEAEKSAREQERKTRIDTFAVRRREVEEQKSPVDAALRAGRSSRAACEQSIKQAEGALARTPGDKDLDAKLASARAQLPGLTAEEDRLAAESRQYAGRLTAIDADQKTALAPIDAALSRIQAELQGTSQQASATEKDRGETFAGLGTKLYESGATIPALTAEFEKVAAIDKARGDTESALHASAALTQALAPGTMAKFWLVVVGVPLVLIVLLNVVQRRSTPEVESSPIASNTVVDMQTPAPTGDPEEAKRQVIEDFVHRAVMGSDDSDKPLHEKAVGILKHDIDTMGASGQPEYLPMLTKVLASPEPELRAAAADSIGMIGPTDAETPELSKLLNDKSPEVVKAAKRALAAPRGQ